MSLQEDKESELKLHGFINSHQGHIDHKIEPQLWNQLYQLAQEVVNKRNRSQLEEEQK